MKRFLFSILAFMTLALLGHQAATATTYNCAGLTDTYLDQGSPDINYGADTDMTVSGNSAGAAVCRGIIRLNTPSFVEAGQIQNATLYLYGKTGSSPAIDIYALTTNCYEKHHDDPQGKHIDGATWNIRGKAGPAQYYWTNPGAEGDYDTNISSSGTIASGWNSIDVTTLLTGNLDLVRRFGMLIKVSDEEVDVNQTIGSLKDIANAPYLELEVDLGLAGETYLCPNIADIYLDEGYPDANFNHKVRALLATDTIHHYGIARGLFKFEIPDSVNASSIQSAALNLSGSIHTGGGAGGDVFLYALNTSFDEDTDTWNTLAGGDYDTCVGSGGTLPGTNDWETAIDVTTLLTGNLDKVRDNGMVLMFQDEYQTPSIHQNIASRECFDAEDFSAYLKITYSTVWYVDNDPPSGDGSSWEEAFATIQEAIDASGAGDEIWVKTATYVLATQINVDEVVSIYGGFTGTETLLEQRDWETNVTTVDGNNTTRCVYITSDASIDGLTIVNGQTSDKGAGLWNGEWGVYEIGRAHV